MTALTNQRTVNPEQRPGEQPKRLTVWFGPQDAAAVKEVFDEARSDPYATKINVKVRVEDSGTDLLSGMEWVSYIISNSHYTEAVRKRLRRRSQFIRVEVMSADIIVGGNRDAPK